MPIVVDLACGAGGFSEGYVLAGGHRADLLGVDWSKPARDSYEAAGFRAIHADLFQVEDAVQRILIALKGRRPLVVIGSSVCKGWTAVARRKGANDERDTLQEWCTVAGALRPEVVIMENVPRAKRHPEWTPALQALRMPLVAEWTLPAHMYGAPTTRARTFWVWRRDGFWPPRPTPTPVEPRFGSPLSQAHDRKVPLKEVLPGPGFRRRPMSFEDALLALGAPGKVFCGDAIEQAQQVADMLPPPLTAAVLKSSLRGCQVVTIRGNGAMTGGLYG